MQRLNKVDELVQGVISDGPAHTAEAVAQLVKEHRDLAEERRRGLAFVGEVASYLRLQPSGAEPSAALFGIQKALQVEASGPHRPLRLGLTASLAAWSRGVEQLRQSDQKSLLDVLRLDPVEQYLCSFLESIENATLEALGEDLLSGFPKKWLFTLFRAEILMDTYFSHVASCEVLRGALKLASGTIRIALQHFDCRVLHIDLLASRPFLPVAEDRIIRKLDTTSEFRDIAEVKVKVAPLVESGEDIFVDVRSFVWLRGQEMNWRFEVVGINPGDWRD